MAEGDVTASFKQTAVLFQTLSRYCQSGEPDKALPLFDQMRMSAMSNPENVSISTLLGSAASSLNHAYGKAGEFGKARRIIQEMAGLVNANGVSVVDTRSLESTLEMLGG